MHILKANNNHNIIGGSDTVYLNTGRLLLRRGHDVSWFSSIGDIKDPQGDESFFPASTDIRKPKLSDVPRYLYNRQARKSIERLISEKATIDIAHLHIYQGLLTPSILGPLKERGIPIVQTLHEYKLACPVYTMERDGDVCDLCVRGTSLNLLRYRCKNKSLALSALVFLESKVARLLGDVEKISKFICVSEFQKRIMIEAGIPKTKLIALHNFISEDLFLEPEPTPTGDYFLYFGRIEKLKGMATLIEAAKMAGVKLVIAGNGAWLPRMRELIAGEPNISYVGFLQGRALIDSIRNSLGVVVPSEWYENCPMSVLETKALGRPVIGANIGGIPELINDGTDGLLFSPGNAAELAEKLMVLLSSGSQGFGEAARQDAYLRFSPISHARRLEAVYQSVMADY